MSDTAVPPRQLPTFRAAGKTYSVQNHNSSLVLSPLEVLEEGQEPAIRWELLVQELFESSTRGLQTATANAWRGNLKVGQIDFEFRPTNWTIMFQSDNDFTRIHALSTVNTPVAIVFRNRTETRVVLFDPAANQFVGDNTDVGTCTFPAQGVAANIRDGLEALGALESREFVVFQESQGDAKARCESTRKAKLAVVVGVAVSAAVGIFTGGASLLVQATLAVAAGMVAGGTARAVNNDAEKCKEDAEEDNPQ